MNSMLHRTAQQPGQLQAQQLQHSTKHIRAATRTRRRLAAVAFRQAEAAAAAAKAPAQELTVKQGPTVLVPLDFYACLGVTRTAGARAVRDALDRALVKRPEAYYSSDTVALRDLLLRNAAECLLNYDKRRGYDAKGANGYVVSVSEDHLPGALVLLQESGYSQLVLDLGTQWLAVNRQDVRRRDVTAAMAQAHHTLAVQGLQQEAGCMLESCRHLETALLLMRQSLRGSEHAAVASDLQRDVMQLLKDYSPDYCLALLALPLDDAQRKRGHALLRKLLWELPDDMSPLAGVEKDDFLAAARALMTAQEHLDLQKAAPKGALGVAQQQVQAEATVAVAFQRCQPLVLLKAADAFRRLERAAGQEVEVDMCVERACIALLLGKTAQALQELGLTAQAQQQADINPTKQAAQQYLLAHCPDRSDLLPGAYALAQCWMQQGILGSFRQQAGAVTAEQQQQQQQPGDLDLAPWFDSLLVRLVILVFATLDRLKQAVHAVIGFPAAVIASLVWAQQRVLQSKQAPPSTVRLAQVEARGASDASSSTGSHRSSAVVDSRAERSEVTTANPTSSQHVPGKAKASQLSRQATANAPQQQQPQAKAAPKAAAPSAFPAPQPQQTLPTLHGVKDSKQQGQQSNGKSRLLVAGAGSRDNAAEKVDSVTSAEAKAGAAVEGSSLMARARAAAVKDRGLRGAAASTDEDEAGPAPSPAAVKKLSQQMSALEAQMWDPAPEPTGWKASVNKALSVVLVGAALAVVVSGSRQHAAVGSAPQGPCTLLVDARG